MTVMLSFLLPDLLHQCRLHSENVRGEELTLYRVGLGELGEVHEEVLWEVIPLLAFLHAEVDVRARQLVDVELQFASLKLCVLEDK